MERLVESIPVALASAMLAGVLLTLCVAPFRAVVASPAAIAPVMVVWLLLIAFARRWAVIGALAAAGAALADPASREAGAVTLVVAASGVTIAGVGAASGDCSPASSCSPPSASRRRHRP